MNRSKRRFGWPTAHRHIQTQATAIMNSLLFSALLTSLISGAAHNVPNFLTHNSHGNTFDLLHKDPSLLSSSSDQIHRNGFDLPSYNVRLSGDHDLNHHHAPPHVHGKHSHPHHHYPLPLRNHRGPPLSLPKEQYPENGHFHAPIHKKNKPFDSLRRDLESLTEDRYPHNGEFPSRHRRSPPPLRFQPHPHHHIDPVSPFNLARSGVEPLSLSSSSLHHENYDHKPFDLLNKPVDHDY